MSRVLRVDFNDRYLGQIAFGGRRSYLVGAGVHWAVGGPEVTLGMPVEQQVRAIIQANKNQGTGYNELIAGGVVYQLAPWDRVVGPTWAGSPGSRVRRKSTRSSRPLASATRGAAGATLT